MHSTMFAQSAWRQLSCALAVAVLGTGCKGTREQLPAATDKPVLPIASVQNVADTTTRKRPPRPTNPCTFSTTGNACYGVLGDKDPTFDELHPKNAYLVPKNTSQRQPDSDQIVQTYVNMGARDLDLDELKSGTSVVVGSLEFTAGKQADGYYKVGGGGTSNKDSRTVWIVVGKPPTFPAPSGDDPVVAHWTMYGIDKSGNVTKVAGPGKIIECTEGSDGHDPSTVPDAYFTTCKPVSLMHTLARSLKRPFDSILAYVACRPDANGSCTRPQPNAPHGFNVMSADERKLFLAALPTILANPSTSPFWFTCGQGCCTAEL